MQLLDQEKKVGLLNEFQNLTTLDEKLNFWTDRLPLNYIAYWDLGSERPDLFNDLSPFNFQVEAPDREKFAKWILDNYHEFSKKQNPYKHLLDFDHLRKAFEKELQDSEDKLEVVRRKLAFIRKDIKRPMPYSGNSLQSRFAAMAININSFNADFQAFEDYKEQRISPDYSEVYPNIQSILRAENGHTVGKFWVYLKGLETELQDQGKTKQATLDQKLLMLHYLGTLKEIMKAENSSKQGIFLEKLIGNDHDKIRQRFSSIFDLIDTPKETVKKRKLKEDLIEVQVFFDELGLKILVKKIQADLRKLSQ